LNSGHLKIKKFNEYECHLGENSDSIENSVNYLFVLDSMNFCFWPSSTGIEYDNLAAKIKHIS
jgi:hypothetical protein